MKCSNPIWLVATALLVVACSSEDGETASAPDVIETVDVPQDVPSADAVVEDDVPGDVGEPIDTPVLVSGSTELFLDDDGTIRLAHGGVHRLSLPLDALQLGVVDEISDTLAYDPVFFEPDAYWGDLWLAPKTLIWLAPTAVEVEEDSDPDDSGNALRLTLSYEGGRTASVVITAPRSGQLTAVWTAGEGAPAAYYRIAARASETEGFYGLGEYFDRPEHRGKVRAMNFEPSGLESGHNEAHVPIPFVIGTRGWGLFVESMRPAAFALGVTEDDLVRATFGQGEAWADGLRFHLFTATHAIDVTRLYYETTGYPKLPAPWALGPVIWRDEVDGQDAVEDDFLKLRSLDLASTGYWIDRPYASGVNSFDFHPAKYTDAASMIGMAHGLGLRVALWHTPYLDPDDPATMALNQQAKDAGYYPPKSGASSPNWGPSIDLTNPAAKTFWQEQLKAYIDLGIEGFKLDFAEEHIPGIADQRTFFEFFDGSNELTMHRRFQHLYHEAYAELLPEDGGMLLVRAGVYGDQVNGVIVWPGDIDATLALHGDTVTKANGDSYVSVGGLPAAISAGSSLGPSGYPFFGSDTGGYRNSPPAKETYIRWFQQTALSTCMQVGTNTNDLPWSFGPDKVQDEEILSLYRKYARLHLRLFPYLWSYATDIAQTGRPIQRPVGLAEPTLNRHPAFDYLLGDDLLVAPVIEAGATTREVTFPSGQWIHWWTGEAFTGGTAYSVNVTLEDIPLFLGDGAIVPLLRADIDTLNAVTDDEVVTLKSTDEHLHIVMTPTLETRERTLYDGTTIRLVKDFDRCPVSQTIEATPGSQFSSFTIELRHAVETSYETIRFGGVEITEAESVAALELVESGWVNLPEGGPRGLVIKLPPNDAQAGVELWEECPE
ncbi:MAG: alpha-D-xyloside xylohydrolase [Myxococcota bacterium]|jgi:alpha-D-xyloside xylohydrolase